MTASPLFLGENARTHGATLELSGGGEMAGGRPRKMSCVSTGKIGKEARAEREIQESKLKLGRDDLKPPAFLDFDGQKEFKRVVKEAKKSIFWTIWI